LTDRYLSSGFAGISTRLRTKIAQHYKMEVIESIRIVFRLGYTVNQCMDAGHPQDIKKECIKVLNRGYLITT